MRDRHVIFQIDDVLISSDIFTEYFSCDYEKCKGCCCIIGDSGAPLEEEECESIEKTYPIFSKRMSPERRAIVDRVGFFDIDCDGDIVTPLNGNSEECLYCCFDKQDNCFCSIEKSYFAGEIPFRKPISCWLYPIRVSKLSNGLTALNLHRWNICKVAFDKGKKEGVLVYEFLKDPLIALYGEEFYNAMGEAAKTLEASE